MWWQHEDYYEWGYAANVPHGAVHEVLVFPDGTSEDEIGVDFNGVKDGLFLAALAKWGKDYRERAVVGRWPHVFGIGTCIGIAFPPPENNRP